MATQNSINKASGSLTIDPGASGDSYLQYNINTTGEFRIGVDDDASDAFKISQGSALGANDTFTISAAGEINKPLQPAFLAVLDSDILNVTGDGTIYTVVWDTEVFDQNNDFDGTSTFTAPIDGYYRFEASILCMGLAAVNDGGELSIITSDRLYKLQNAWGIIRDASDKASYCISVLADMDAADTAYARISVGSGTKVVDIDSNGSTDPNNWFSGNLEC